MKTFTLLALGLSALLPSLANATVSVRHNGCIRTDTITCEISEGFAPKKGEDGCYMCVKEAEPSCIKLAAGQFPTIECNAGYHLANVGVGGEDCYSCVQD